MTEPIDYEKCKTERFGLYAAIAMILVMLLGLTFPITQRIESKLDALQPCVQQGSVTK